MRAAAPLDGQVPRAEPPDTDQLPLSRATRGRKRAAPTAHPGKAVASTSPARFRSRSVPCPKDGAGATDSGERLTVPEAADADPAVKIDRQTGSDGVDVLADIRPADAARHEQRERSVVQHHGVRPRGCRELQGGQRQDKDKAAESVL